MLANTNGDEDTSKNEWSSVYESLNIDYSRLSSIPYRDLTNEHMKRFLEQN